jgi:hypothetical protein
MVFYSENAAIDTLPHEYAHVYVNMLKSTNIVRNILNAISKQYGMDTEAAEEFLVKHMGEKYVEWYMSETKDKSKVHASDTPNWFVMIDKLWKVIKNVFATPETRKILKDMDLLASNFYKGANNDAIRTSPLPGYEKVSLENTLLANPNATEIILDVLNATGGKSVLTGSAALAEQVNIYRKGADGVTDLHDLDLIIPEGATRDEYAKKALKELRAKWNVVTTMDFVIPSNKRLLNAAKTLGKFIPSSQLGVAAKLTRLLQGNKVTTSLVVDKKYKIVDIVRHNGSNSRVIGYSIVDAVSGKVVGTYKAEVRSKPNSYITEIVNETTTGVKAITLDLITNKVMPDTVEYSNSSALGDKAIKLSNEEHIFEAKRNLGDTPRSKDIMDHNFIDYDNKRYSTITNKSNAAAIAKAKIRKADVGKTC